MKILIIGCGSIGQRHIKNLVKLKARKIVAFDTNEERLNEAKTSDTKIKVFNTLADTWNEKPNLAFITVPTALHINYALEAARRGCHLFIEKPLSHNLKNINRLLEIVRRKKLITMVACNMRFYWSIAKIKTLLEKNTIGKVISARIETGQYLPDWHPWEDYRKMYSAKKKLGGGVILDAIHEIDYALWFFGEVSKVYALHGKLSSLEIETEDIAEILLRFKTGIIANIHMDYIQRYYSRNCKIIGEEGIILWDFNEHCVKLYQVKSKRWRVFKEPKNYNTNQMYLDEIKYFLNQVKKQTNTFNNIVSGLGTLKIALRCKK